MKLQVLYLLEILPLTSGLGSFGLHFLYHLYIYTSKLQHFVNFTTKVPIYCWALQKKAESLVIGVDNSPWAWSLNHALSAELHGCNHLNFIRNHTQTDPCTVLCPNFDDDFMDFIFVLYLHKFGNYSKNMTNIHIGICNFIPVFSWY